jgi:hypothetical protein
MATLQEQILKTSKEIIVKFIETGRVSPNSFDETFRSIHTTVKETVYQAETNIDKNHSLKPDKKT